MDRIAGGRGCFPKHAILLLMLTVLFPSLSPGESCASLCSVQWLIGDWVADGGERRTLESWTAVSPGTFEGVGETRSKAGDQLVSRESLRLIEMSGKVFYLAKVAHNDLPVAFKLVDCSDHGAVFANAGHDFPKQLSYRLVSENEMTVTVTDGASKGFSVHFKRQGHK